MEFDPDNKIVKLCIQGMAAEDRGNAEDASGLYLQAWNESTNDFEKFLAAYYVARSKSDVREKLRWLETALRLGVKVNDVSTFSAFPLLYTRIAECYEQQNNAERAKENRVLAESSSAHPRDNGPFYHGTRADLQVGDLLKPGGNSNYQSDLVMNHIYFTAIANGAGLAAALANGGGRERVYIVEPIGPFENDPNVTDRKFPGNPTRSYRSTAPLKIVGELTDWARQTPEQIQAWQERLANSKGEIIN